MSEAGRSRALDFAWPAVTDAVLDVHAQVLGRRRLAAATMRGRPARSTAGR